MKTLILIVFCSFLVFTSCDDNSSDINKREINQEQLDNAAQNSDYNYFKEIEVKENPFFKFIGPLFRLLSSMFGSWIGYVILAFVVLLIVIYLIKISKNSIVIQLDSNPHSTSFASNKDDINLEGYTYASLEALVNDALEKQDFRTAIRFSFLSAIYLLNEEGAIELHVEKTNAEYIAELPLNTKSKFTYLSNIYDYVLYGEYQVNEAIWSMFYSERVKLNKIE